MNYTIVFDTETVGITRHFVYNLGYVVLNDCHVVVLKRNFVIREIFRNKPLMLADFGAAQYEDYKQLIAQKPRLYVGLKRALNQMTKDIKTYEIKEAYAYNSRFDFCAFKDTIEFYPSFGGRFKHLINPLLSLSVCDIMQMPKLKAIFASEDYIAFCQEHNRLTKTKLVSRTAETAYIYLSRCLDFKEKHTALEDSIAEAYIYSVVR